MRLARLHVRGTHGTCPGRAAWLHIRGTHGTCPGMDEQLRRSLESDIRMTQERFCAAMEARLPAIEDDSLERYFGVLSKLVTKLEDPDKSLGQIMNEMMAETASVLMQEMQSRR